MTLGYQPSTCSDGCLDALRLVSFSDILNPASSSYYTGQCSSNFLLSSLAACSSTYCTSKESTAGWETFGTICKDYGKVTLPPLPEVLGTVPRNLAVVNTLLSDGKVWDEPILVSREAFDAGLRTEVSSLTAGQIVMDSGVAVLRMGSGSSGLGKDKTLCIMVRRFYPFFFHSAPSLSSRSSHRPDYSFRASTLAIFLSLSTLLIRTHHPDSWSMYIFLALLVLLGTLNRFLTYRTRRTPLVRPRATSPSLLGRLNTLKVKYITMPMFYRYKNTSTWGFIRLPNRLHGILVAVYVGVNVIFVFAGYETFDDNLYWRNDRAVSDEYDQQNKEAWNADADVLWTGRIFRLSCVDSWRIARVSRPYPSIGPFPPCSLTCRRRTRDHGHLEPPPPLGYCDP